jgi:imidazolonepropionase-like amidohydrolase
MADVMFTNVRVFDGGGETPFTGDVLVQGNKISRVVKTGYGARSAPVAGAQVIDGAGAFLMPGMVEAHTHFSWNDQPSTFCGAPKSRNATSTWAGPVVSAPRRRNRGSTW